LYATAHAAGLADMAGAWRFRTHAGRWTWSDPLLVSAELLPGNETVARQCTVWSRGMEGAAGEGWDGSIVVVLPTFAYCQVWRIRVQRPRVVSGVSEFFHTDCRRPFLGQRQLWRFRGTRVDCGDLGQCFTGNRGRRLSDVR
jgi:hypothetical protein